MTSLIESDDSYEQILCVVREVQVFKLPARTTTSGYKAAEWNDSLIWKGRLRVLERTKGSKAEAEIRLEDKDSGDLFATCPYDSAAALEPVLDSSRYFVLRVVNPATQNKAYLGLGFEERTDSFDFNVALQDFTRRQKAGSSSAASSTAKTKTPVEPIDFSLKEGESISISLGGAKPTVTKPPEASGGAIPLLAPPPSANAIRRPR